MSDIIKEIEACIAALRRYSAVVLCNREQGDDLARDCLVHAVDGLHRRQAGGDSRLWLFSILHQLFARRRRQATVSENSGPMELLGPGPAGYGSDRDTYLPSQELLRALAGLSAEERGALVLVVLEDFSYADVSRITGVPIGTVMSRLSSARNRLRQAVDETPVASLRRVK